jgi:hypothetical protein
VAGLFKGLPKAFERPLKGLYKAFDNDFKFVSSLPSGIKPVQDEA